MQGVGSHTAAMLLRSGVRRLRLVDFDQVQLQGVGMDLSKPHCASAFTWRPMQNNCTRICGGRPFADAAEVASMPSPCMTGQACVIGAMHSCQVTLSSLNRHAVATRADVGLPKATVLARHFDTIVPEASVEVKLYCKSSRAVKGWICICITITASLPLQRRGAHWSCSAGAPWHRHLLTVPTRHVRVSHAPALA